MEHITPLTEVQADEQGSPATLRALAARIRRVAEVAEAEAFEHELNQSQKRVQKPRKRTIKKQKATRK